MTVMGRLEIAAPPPSGGPGFQASSAIGPSGPKPRHQAAAFLQEIRDLTLCLDGRGATGERKANGCASLAWLHKYPRCGGGVPVFESGE